ncbi:unnamed protein product [Alopecurus aequalis]
MSAVLRHAARKLGGSMAQRAEAAVAEGRRRVVTRRLYSTEEGLSEGKKTTPGGFEWRQPLKKFAKGAGTCWNGLAHCGNFAIKFGVLVLLASESPLFRKKP